MHHMKRAVGGTGVARRPPDGCRGSIRTVIAGHNRTRILHHLAALLIRPILAGGTFGPLAALPLGFILIPGIHPDSRKRGGIWAPWCAVLG
ncbi:hypothetical protein NicSoilB11_21950 [Arthrobacter sp. NicSoilB11]|nr:hypothetical protein NicSoilB11_21950 [Arthrobacter sp. NicSoilB11]